MKNTYIAIDLKSFYASAECAERSLNPLTTNLVVADISRTEKTICLAVSPSLKAYGLPGRCRLFEVVQKVRDINYERKRKAPGHRFTGKSSDAEELARDPSLELDYVIATPQMAHYIQISSKIYSIYLRYIAAEDIHVYSIDEVFMDVTHYLKTYKMTAHELAIHMIRDVLKETGITATAGIGENLYLAKVAMDVVAKHIPADKDGVRIAELDEMSYRKTLWEHQPLTDFWRVGRGLRAKLEAHGMYTMGDIAVKSMEDENLLYRLFGVNAELLIDHAWGYEPCTIKEIKAYKPEKNSLGSGQVLSCGYDREKARIVVREMADLLVLDLVEQKLKSNGMALAISYDAEGLKGDYDGEVALDYYGRAVPKGVHASAGFGEYSSSTRLITETAVSLFDAIMDPNLKVRRLYMTFLDTIPEDEVKEEDEQLGLFVDYDALEKKRAEQKKDEQKEKQLQNAILDIRRKYGKNMLLKGTDLEEGATAKERNEQIGGHKA